VATLVRASQFELLICVCARTMRITENEKMIVGQGTHRAAYEMERPRDLDSDGGYMIVRDIA
jgi:hypothetical protein